MTHGKARVHELAKELGVTAREILVACSSYGEFVKSASSTLEARQSAVVHNGQRV
jgi:translation initiation factor IF-2